MILARAHPSAELASRGKQNLESTLDVGGLESYNCSWLQRKGAKLVRACLWQSVDKVAQYESSHSCKRVALRR